ncbi:VTT domain-containing protein [Pedobacter sp.]|nr:VTT domain-containing protein [Candidatus Saccharibacteria bacterium]
MKKYYPALITLLCIALLAFAVFFLHNFEIQSLITTVGVIGVAAIVFAESGLLVGFFLPGDSLLFTAGFLAQQGILDINIHVLVAILFVAAAAGDSVGYTFGNKVGRRIFNRKDSLVFKKENIVRAEAFYEKHGSITIVIARFIPIIRTFAPVVAGVGKMKYPTFLAYNLIGALLWAAGITYFGYFAGAWFTSIGLSIDQVLLPIIALIILLSILPPAIHILKDKKRRKLIISTTAQQLRKVFLQK